MTKLFQVYFNLLVGTSIVNSTDKKGVVLVI